MKKLLLIAIITLCSIPLLKSSYWSKISQSTAASYHKHYHKMNASSIGLGIVGTGYLIVKENVNGTKIDALSQELKNAQDTLAQIENQSVSKTTFWTVTAILGFGCYIAARTTYHNNKLLSRPAINIIVSNTQTTSAIIDELKKHSYKKQDFIVAKISLSKNLSDADIKTIEAALS